MSKYHAVRTTIDGITFDSKREAARYSELKLLELAGEITSLTVHPRFLLADGFNIDGKGGRVRPIYYIADFKYLEGDDSFDSYIVEDVKGGKATQTAVFKLKAKLFRARYPEYELRIVK